jgi:hypothetical protein
MFTSADLHDHVGFDWRAKMKNILVIDDGINCTYDIFEASNDDFLKIFPAEGQDIEFVEDFFKREGKKKAGIIMDRVYSTILDKKTVVGIHGTLFVGLLIKKRFYLEKKDPPITDRLVPL